MGECDINFAESAVRQLQRWDGIAHGEYSKQRVKDRDRATRGGWGGGDQRDKGRYRSPCGQKDALAHGRPIESPIDQHPGPACERAGIAVDPVTVEIEPFVEENGSRFHQKQSQVPEQVRCHGHRLVEACDKCTDRVSDISHRVELKTKRGEPCKQPLTMTLRWRKRSVNQARPRLPRADQPAIAQRSAGRDDRR